MTKWFLTVGPSMPITLLQRRVKGAGGTLDDKPPVCLINGDRIFTAEGPDSMPYVLYQKAPRIEIRWNPDIPLLKSTEQDQTYTVR